MLWNLSAGALHVTDASNAFITGLLTTDAAGWDEHVLEELSVPRSTLPGSSTPPASSARPQRWPALR